MALLENYVQVLSEFIRYKSISTDSAFLPDIQVTAEALLKWLTEKGFKGELIVGYNNPLVLAEYVINKDYPTCLVYGHYDVQPAEQTEGWLQDPFELTRQEGRLVARGAVDNKGQFLVHLTAIADLIKKNNLKWNVQVILEGNEETGSEGIIKFLHNHPEKIKATVAMVSDGEMHGLEPKLEVGFRGTMQLNVGLNTSDRDLHSGLFGGTVPNAALELSRLLASLHLEKAGLKVKNIANGVHVPTEQEKAWADYAGSDQAAYQELSGTKVAWSEENESIGSQLIFRPALEIIGLSAGYMGEGFLNSIPGTASAKLNFRMAPGQDPEQAYQYLCEYMRAQCPDYAQLSIERDPSYNAGVLVAADEPILKEVSRILEKVYGTPPRFQYCGASLPFLESLQQISGLVLVVVPLGNEDCLMHAVGENISLAHVEKALSFSELFFSTPLS